MAAYFFLFVYLLNNGFVIISTQSQIKEFEDPTLFEGDIVLSPQERANVNSGKFAFASSVDDLLWPKGVAIPYEIASSIETTGLQAIRDAMTDIEKYTCIRFKKRGKERQYLYFFRGPGCSSPVGRKYRNDISLGRNCWKKGYAIHEIAHSLGMYHEQSRPDRDGYVKILWENIQGDERVNFQKEPANMIDSYGTPYDLKSVMHYPSNAFGGGKMTIKVLDSSKQHLIGQRDGLSDIDIKQLNLMYSCGSVNPPTKVTTALPPVKNCLDLNQGCSYWANKGYCFTSKDKDYMKKTCCKSCKEKCEDNHQNCSMWAGRGECTKNPSYMLRSCQKSCKVC